MLERRVTCTRSTFVRAGRYEGFEDALATAAAEDSGWSWTGTRALTAMKDMLSPRYSAIMSMSAYPESKGNEAPLPVRSQGSARAIGAKAPLRITETEEPTQVQIPHHHKICNFAVGGYAGPFSGRVSKCSVCHAGSSLEWRRAERR